ncbi:hypothetical protein BG004_002296 [Podila humilis]|nr:hypothetical protein BG004_002296 [Podila humilis]
MRYANLVIFELKRHPEYTAPQYKSLITALKKDASVAMNEIQYLNPILDKKYETYMEHVRKREEKLHAQEREARLHHEAQKQQEMQLLARRQQDEHWANSQPAQDWSLVKALEGIPGVNSTQSTLHNHGHNHHHQHHHHHHHLQQQQQQHPSIIQHEFQYPERIQRQHPSQRLVSSSSRVVGRNFCESMSEPTSVLDTRQQALTPTPTGPPPALPRKPLDALSAPMLPPNVHEFPQGLRTMTVPVRLLDRFLNIVRPNTIKKLETCGILAGVLSRNKLTVTTLIIPKQTATSDTCSTTNEDELFEFQMARDLMTLGWIHTHPTQTCFMSSVDLHTHCSYQLMLPEAIAIVCAPSHEKDYGVFRLTDPPGLQVITNCRQKPLFHQHPGEDDIYTDACNQGHVELVDLDLDIVDLRSK